MSNETRLLPECRYPEVLRAALERIIATRDHMAENGEYPVGTLGEDQCFDDWAADHAEQALTAACGPQRGQYAVETAGETVIELERGEHGTSGRILITSIGDEHLERLVLAHACAGVNIDSPAYREGLETAMDAIAGECDD